MNVRMAAVCSIDGKLTRGEDPDITSWASAEDHEHFKALIASHEVIVMGRKTYEAARQSFKSSPPKRRIIVTRNPQGFAGEAVDGKFEFTDELPADLLKRLQNEAVSSVLVVGGGDVNGAFLAAGLIDEIYLTIEPLVFGGGTNFAGSHHVSTTMTLLSMKQLNLRGSVLLHYSTR